MDQTTRKLMTVQKALHSTDDVDSLYVPRKGGKRIASIEDNFDSSIQRREDFTKKCGGRLITASRNYTVNTRINRTKITRMDTSSEKQAKSQTRRLGRG